MMGSNKVIRLPKKRCQFCGREATLMCDKVKGEYTRFDYPEPGAVTSGLLTCDKKICKKCATHIDGADYCPDCIKKIRKKLK